MKNILVRMSVVIGVLVVVQLGYSYVFGLTNPTVVPPKAALSTFPKVIKADTTGNWTGNDEKLDNREFNYAELDECVNRVYTSRDSRSVSLLLGLYNRPSVGLYHNPFNCYHTHGFTMTEQMRRPLQTAPDRPDGELNLSVWEKKGERFVVGFWYEVGDYTMFERHDLLGTQWAMRGKSKWPAMFKVLIEAPVGNDIDQAKTDVLEMAKAVRKWLGTAQPLMD